MWKYLALDLHIVYNQWGLGESDSPGETKMFGEYFKGNNTEGNYVIAKNDP